VYLRASTEFAELVGTTEAALKKLGLEYTKNGTDKLWEFEIYSPAYFRIVVEPRSDARVHNNPILPSISRAKGSTLEIRAGLDSDEEERAKISAMVKEIGREIVASLDKKPWHDLGFRESGQEKRKWISLIER
jgi:hypothetical protein